MSEISNDIVSEHQKISRYQDLAEQETLLKIIEQSSDNSADTEQESFDFTVLMKRLKETRQSTVNPNAYNTELIQDKDVNKLFRPVVSTDYLNYDGKENKRCHINSDLNDSEDNYESDIEVSWRPLDEIALKYKSKARNRLFFKPMDNELRQDSDIEHQLKYKEAFTSAKRSKDKYAEICRIGKEVSTENLMATHVNDNEYFLAEEVLQSIKDDIKQTCKKVDDINDFIKIKLDSRPSSFELDEIIVTENKPNSSTLPGSFPEGIANVNDFVNSPAQQTAYFDAISNMKWLASWPIKWKLFYFIIYHLISFSDLSYSFEKKCDNLMNNLQFLTLSEFDKLLGCYMFFRVISTNLFDLSSSIREFYDCLYQYFVLYNELHPLLRKWWTELLIYGGMNLTFIVMGATILHIYLVPKSNSSPVYHCLWQICFGSSQRIGFTIMLMMFYLDLTQEGLNKLKKDADHIIKEELEHQEKLNGDSLGSLIGNHNKENLPNLSALNEDVLLESTPPIINQFLSPQSPLLKKSSNLNADRSLKLVSVSSRENEAEVNTTPNDFTTSKTEYPDLFEIIIKVLLITSKFLQQPLKTTKRLLPERIFAMLRKINADSSQMI